MGFWIFMLISDLLIPCTMIGFGKYFIIKAPKRMNGLFGYRTRMSMKNQDTWEFSHQYSGRIWYVWGMILLPITVIAMLLVIGRTEGVVGIVGGIICGIQMIPMLGVIFFTEKALKKNFDEDGNRR